MYIHITLVVAAWSASPTVRESDVEQNIGAQNNLQRARVAVESSPGVEGQMICCSARQTGQGLDEIYGSAPRDVVHTDLRVSRLS